MKISYSEPSQGSRRRTKALLGLLVIVVAIIGVTVWSYVEELKSEFPDLDFHRSRVGIASWYSRTDKGIHKRTANNELFDDQAMTCASWYYPFGEQLLVINTFNGNWVVCRVNDRGPAAHLRRTIDLTRAAFRKLSPLDGGLIYVTVIPTAKNHGLENQSGRGTAP